MYVEAMHRVRVDVMKTPNKIAPKCEPTPHINRRLPAKCSVIRVFYLIVRVVQP